METCNNLPRDSMHPQGVGRWVPGDDAATLPLAALRGTRFLAYQQVCLVAPFRAPCSRTARYDFYQVLYASK